MINKKTIFIKWLQKKHFCQMISEKTWISLNNDGKNVIFVKRSFKICELDKNRGKYTNFVKKIIQKTWMSSKDRCKTMNFIKGPMKTSNFFKGLQKKVKIYQKIVKKHKLSQKIKKKHKFYQKIANLLKDCNKKVPT